MIRLLFTSRNHPGSWIIRAVTWSSWSHVGFLCENDDVIDAAALRGVRRVPFQEAIKGVNKYATVEFCEGDEKALEAILTTQLLKGYDYLGALGIGFNKNFGQDNKWSCGEMISWGLDFIGNPVFRKDQTKKLSPEDFWRRQPVGKTDIVRISQLGR